MATITLKGNEIHTVGELPAVGTEAPDFSLVTTALQNVSLADFSGKKLVFNIFPSIDTGICAMSTRRFNADAADRDDVAVLCISADLPFAHKRFCGAEGIENAHALSTLRDPEFGARWGVQIADGPMAGLMSRAVVVADEDGKVLYTEQVPEIAQQPNYDAALAALG